MVDWDDVFGEIEPHDAKKPGDNCPVCGETSGMSRTEDSQLVCRQCGHMDAHYTEFEMDDINPNLLAHRRRSQADDAQRTRERLTREDEKETFAGQAQALAVDEEALFAEGVAIYVKHLADALVEHGLVSNSIYKPLECIVMHWVVARNESVAKVHWHRAYVLSLLALGALYIRAPILPRDFVVFSMKGILPYFSAPSHFPEEIRKDVAVFRKIAPGSPPSVFTINRGMAIFGCEMHAWKPLRAFFSSSPKLYFVKNLVHSPVGDADAALKRIVKSIGLPEEFVDRVKRFQEIRIKAHLQLNKVQAPYPTRIGKFGQRKQMPPPGCFSFRVPDHLSCCEFPTDRTLLVDVINTIRLCYSTHNGRIPVGTIFGPSGKGKDAKEWRNKLERESDNCERFLQERDLIGGSEDRFLVDMDLYSSAAIRGLRNEELEHLCEYSEMIEYNKNDQILPTLHSYIEAFKQLAFDLADKKLMECGHCVELTDEEVSGVQYHLSTERTFGSIPPSGDGTQDEAADEKGGKQAELLVPPVHSGDVELMVDDLPIDNLIDSIQGFFFACPPEPVFIYEDEQDKDGTEAGKESSNVITQMNSDKDYWKFIMTSMNQTMVMVLDYVQIYERRGTHRRDEIENAHQPRVLPSSAQARMASQ